MTLGQNSPGRDLKNRYLAVGGAMMVGLFALVIGAYRLQITRHEEFVAKSEANFIKDVRLRAYRGMIRDERGNILVDNRPSWDLFITPGFCENCQTEVLPKLAEYLRLPPEEVDAIAAQLQKARRDAKYVPIPVKIDLSRDDHDLLRAHSLELGHGVEVQSVPHRQYHTGTVLSHVLGYMNEITQDELEKMAKSGRAGFYPGDFIGRRGIERFYEAKLRGEDGFRKEVVNASGKTIDLFEELIQDEGKAAKPGNNLILSIDMRLQAEAERAFPGVAGAVVAVEAKTGFIKAMVSRPGFDPNVLTGRISPAQLAAMSKDPLQPMIFRPTQQHYSPGSTFKTFTSLAGLHSGKFATSTTVFCPGGYRLGSRVWRCDLESGHGYVPLRTALQKSCDVYYYRVGDVIGIDALAATARGFGLGSPTGIGVVAEVPGVIPDEDYYERLVPGGYQRGMVLNSAIGQGDVNVTPLQLAMAYAAVANGGTVYTPQLVRRIETADGELVEAFPPKIKHTVDIPAEHRHAVVDALKAVINEPGGTGSAARLPNVLVAGKTGTAQVIRLGKVRLKAHQIDYWHRDNAWFAAFAPADDPELVVVVINEHAGFGASGAAPVAGAVMKKYFELKAEDSGQPITVASTAKAPVKETLPAPAEIAATGPVTSPVVEDAARAAESAALRAQAEVTEPPPVPESADARLEDKARAETQGAIHPDGRADGVARDPEDAHDHTLDGPAITPSLANTKPLKQKAAPVAPAPAAGGEGAQAEPAPSAPAPAAAPPTTGAVVPTPEPTPKQAAVPAKPPEPAEPPPATGGAGQEAP